MKAVTYARLALLIPLLLWVILLLVEALITLVVPVDLRSNEPTTFFGVLDIGILFYVVGIVIWFLPYLVLSIALLLSSYKINQKTLQYLFLLSPFGMAILVMMETTLVSLAAGGFALASPDLANFKTDIGINLLVGIGANLMMGMLALVYGYICVGLGLGGYMLLQRLGIIKEGEKTSAAIINANSQQA